MNFTPDPFLLFKRIRNVSLSLTLFVLIVVLVLFLGTSAICLVVTSKLSLEEAHRTTERTMFETRRMLDSKFDRIEYATRSAAMLTDDLITSDPKSGYKILRHLMQSCPDVKVCGILFREYYYPSMGKEYTPEMKVDPETGDYVPFDASPGFKYIDVDENWIFSSQGENYWSNAYADRFHEGKKLICFSTPMYDRKGELVGVLCSAIGLDWLYDLVESIKPDENSHYAIINDVDQFICASYPGLVDAPSAKELVMAAEDTTYRVLWTKMMNGETGYITFEDTDNDFVQYMPFQRCGWRLAFSYPFESIVARGKILARRLAMIFMLSFLLIALILFAGILAIVKPFSKKLEKATREQAGTESELRIAANIQQEMIPSVFPAFPDHKELDIFAVLKPAKLVGGDIYDFFISNGKLFFCLGDVSGKSIPASIFMAMVKSLFRNVSHHRDDPGQIALEMNREIAPNNPNCMFCTFFVGVLDLSTGDLLFCNAGHNAPAAITASGEVKFIKVDVDTPIGAFEDSEYTTQHAEMNNRDILLLYTDGVTEAENDSKKLFGEKNLLNSLSSRADSAHNVKGIVEKVIEDVHAHAGEAEQSDDITMLAIQYFKINQNNRI
ncbi:MAG: SpoIIE family protein phosphatase [Bacteroidales bacterium]|nr:SpoIIE family protein phosphatase [Bacteroidales bacterium]